jgi:predicted esterase
MRSLLAFTLLFFSLQAMADETGLHIDKGAITVSGISSGAAMAHQLHIAYSDLFSGAAIISGVPYNCAENSIITAMKRCMMNLDEELPLDTFEEQIRDRAKQAMLADPENLRDDRVFIFRGTRDTKISPLVHNSTAGLYAKFIPEDQLRQVKDVMTGHVFPAKGRGNSCTELVPPFVGDCDYDGAGELLNYLYPGLKAPATDASPDLLEVTLAGAEEAELMDTAYLYAPPACSEDEASCALHLVLHGCAQSSEVVGKGFIEQSGYLPWAEANNIVLAFPQVKKSMVAPLNPHGCWDWWGYTDADYANRNGAQMRVLANWVKSLAN